MAEEEDGRGGAPGVDMCTCHRKGCDVPVTMGGGERVWGRRKGDSRGF